MFEWTKIFLTIFLFYLLIDLSHQRPNLAPFHRCYSTNKRLEPFIKWTEHLASSQNRGPKNACQQTNINGSVCCTNEIFNSFTQSLADDLKKLTDAELSLVKDLMSISNKHLELWIKQYTIESRHVTSSSLEILFGMKEYEYHIHHVLLPLYRTLGDFQSSDRYVTKTINELFNQLTISMYRHFMSQNQDLTFDHQFEKCLLAQASASNIFPIQTELLYVLTSASTLVQVLRTMFTYIEADIQRLKISTTFRSYECLQNYANEMLCPICHDKSLTNTIEGLCENDCQLIIEKCFNQTDNPYINFAINAQGYANITKHIKTYVNELKLVDRLSKFHIYLYDMIVNVTNSPKIYTKLQRLCPHKSEKTFQPIQSIYPIISERVELVNQWNKSFYSMLDELQSTLMNLHENLTQQVSKHICSNSNYAVKSIHCTHIDSQVTSSLFSASSMITIDSNYDSIRNQIDDLERKLLPVQNMIESLRPKKRYSIHDDLPILDYDTDNQTIENDVVDNDVQISLVIENKESFSENLYNRFDGKTAKNMDKNSDYLEDDDLSDLLDESTTNRAQIRTTTEVEEDANISSSLTWNIKLYVIVFLLLLTNESNIICF